ncbi:hypothetical protein JCM19235_2178 [Vibrio maritimus]|uniref:Uncharacterized protein n=1 Tax=Vibrio maritimus TaxID=990268 RepID=A0A090RTJ6_9VIBR|nr:hypothetical protein JCM19235_2178 [Vibrio maritimus]
MDKQINNFLFDLQVYADILANSCKLKWSLLMDTAKKLRLFG